MVDEFSFGKGSRAVRGTKIILVDDDDDGG